MGAGEGYPSQEGVFSLNRCLPSADLAFEDLDVRDADNQPITSAAAHRNLEELFRSGLFGLLVRSETYSVARSLGIIEKSLNLASQFFARNLPVAVGYLRAALAPVKKQWNKDVLLTAGMLPFFLLAVPFLVVSLRKVSVPIQIAPTVFRC